VGQLRVVEGVGEGGGPARGDLGGEVELQALRALIPLLAGDAVLSGIAMFSRFRS
jgi:hypothetical protein